MSEENEMKKWSVMVGSNHFTVHSEGYFVDEDGLFFYNGDMEEDGDTIDMEDTVQVFAPGLWTTFWRVKS